MSNTFIDSIKDIALQGWKTHKILPSITIGQAIHESGWGKSDLGKAPNYNLFGIKKSDDWEGAIVNMRTGEYGANGKYYIYADFRKYNSWNESMLDHAAFFTNTPWRTENYKHVVSATDYKVAARALQSAGYATDPSYASILIKIIEDNKLYEYDKLKDSTSVITPSQPINKTVGGVLTNASRDASKQFDVTMIADSLGVGTYPNLQNVFKSFNHDSKGSRQFTHTDPTLNGTTVLNNMKQAGTLKNIVVVVLGTNRGVEQSELNNFMAIAGSERKVLFVNTTSEVAHRNTVAQRLKQASLDHSNAYYVDWMSHSLPLITSYYHADGAGGTRIHMTTAGYQKHAEYIQTAVYEASQQRVVSGQKAQSVIKEYLNIKDVELKDDGTASYTVNGQTQVIHTGTAGLTSPLGDGYIYNHGANKSFGFYKDDKILWVEGTHESSEVEDALQLMNLASKDLAERSIPAVHYTVDLAYLPNTVSIGDRGIIVDHEFNPPLYIEARVLEIQTSDTDPSSNYVLIGNVTELFPEDKSEILKLQQGLQDTRNEVMDELRKGQPLVFTVESSSGELFSQETTLGMRVDKGANIVTDKFDRFVWERISSDNAKDIAFNKLLKDTGQTTSYISIREIDLVDEQSTFRCSVYTGDTLAGSASITIKIAKPGKSAYELAVQNGFVGSLLDWIDSLKGSDGNNGIKGQDGQDGRPSYTHIAYANSSDGRVDFTTAMHVDKEYTFVGMYVDDKEADSQDPNDYNWLYFKGSTTNFYIAYANSEDGTLDFSINDSLNKKYFGSYASTDKEQSLNPEDYAWIETAGRAEEKAKEHADALDKITKDKLADMLNDLQDVQYSLDGKTTIFRGMHAPVGMKNNDLWYRPHPTKDGETQMVIYNGETELWEIVLDTSGESLLTEQMETVKQETQDAQTRANDAYTKAQTAENALIDKVSTEEFESTITQVEDNINLRVEKGDIVNQINISEEDILIDAKKIRLSGDTTVDGDFKVTGDMIAGEITADKIRGGTIDGANMNIINLNADSITGGTINGQDVKIKNLSADSINGIDFEYDEETGKTKFILNGPLEIRANQGNTTKPIEANSYIHFISFTHSLSYKVTEDLMSDNMEKLGYTIRTKIVKGRMNEKDIFVEDKNGTIKAVKGYIIENGVDVTAKYESFNMGYFYQHSFRNREIPNWTDFSLVGKGRYLVITDKMIKENAGKLQSYYTLRLIYQFSTDGKVIKGEGSEYA